MRKLLIRLLVLCASLSAQGSVAHAVSATEGAVNPVVQWNRILLVIVRTPGAQTASQAHNLGTAENARLFALLNLSLADSVIAFYDAKYTYNFWRPVTAIRAAATDDNPETLADPGWLPKTGKTAPDPSYPGAHAVISAAAAEVLRHSSVETISTLM